MPEVTRQITVIHEWLPLGAFRPISVNATSCLGGIVTFEEEVVSSSALSIHSEDAIFHRFSNNISLCFFFPLHSGMPTLNLSSASA